MGSNFKRVALVVRKYRLENTHYSQQDLARLLGYKNGQFISNVERGLCGIPAKKIPKLCHHCAIPLEVMIDADVADHRSRLEKEVYEINTGLYFRGDGVRAEGIVSLYDEGNGRITMPGRLSVKIPEPDAT